FLRFKNSNPDEKTICILTSVAKFCLGDYKGAVVDMDEYLRSEQEPECAYLIRAYAKMQMGDLAGAFDDMIVEIRLNGDSAQARSYLGMIKFRSGKYRESMEDYTKALGYCL